MIIEKGDVKRTYENEYASGLLVCGDDWFGLTAQQAVDII
jgi:hypothetical protein